MFAIPNAGPRMASYRAPSLFQPHRARDALRDAHEGKIPPMICLYFGLSSPQMARFMAPMGWDCVWIDWEHSSCNVETMTDMVHNIMFMSEGKTIPFVRVPGHDHAAIGYALDAGASIVIPQVETVAQAKHCLSAAKFGTAQGGSRSSPPFRLIPGITDLTIDPNKGDIHKNVNDQAAVMIQVESEAGIRNLDAILTACPQIDAVWLGTLDARVSMNLSGNGGMGGPEQEWQDMVALYRETCIKHDKPMAGFAMPGVPGWEELGKGKSFIAVAADVMALLMTKESLLAARGVFGAEPCNPTKAAAQAAALESPKKQAVEANGAANGFVALNGTTTANGHATNGHANGHANGTH